MIDDSGEVLAEQVQFLHVHLEEVDDLVRRKVGTRLATQMLFVDNYNQAV